MDLERFPFLRASRSFDPYGTFPDATGNLAAGMSTTIFPFASFLLSPLMSPASFTWASSLLPASFSMIALLSSRRISPSHCSRALVSLVAA